MLEYEKYHDYVKIIGCGDETFQNLVIPDTIDGLPIKIIGAEAFKDCESLTNVTIPDSVTSIGAEAFRNCTNLANITIPDSVTSIGEEAFRNCTNLASITIPDSVTTIGQSAFQECWKLIEVIIENADCEIIEERVFEEIYKTGGKGATICNFYHYSDKEVGNARWDLFEYEYYYGSFYGVIIGHKDSTAQAYARSCGYRFKAIEDEET